MFSAWRERKENDCPEKFKSFTYFFLAQQIYIYDPSSASISLPPFGMLVFKLLHNFPSLQVSGIQVIS